MVVVVDASAAVDVLLGSARAHAVRQALDVSSVAHAPELVDCEVLSVVRRWELRRWLTEEQTRTVIADFGQFPLVRHRHGLLRPRMWELRHRFTAYDAPYVALAEVLGASLLTTDGRLGRAALGLVDVVGTA